LPNSISAGAPPQTPLGELTALPRIGLRPTFKGRGGEERRGEERERDGKGRRGRKGHWTHLSLLN